MQGLGPCLGIFPIMRMVPIQTMLRVSAEQSSGSVMFRVEAGKLANHYPPVEA